MITPASCSERKSFDSRRAYFSPSFFRGELRRSWPKMLCYALYLFLVLPLPLLFLINTRHNWAADSLTYQINGLFVDGIWLYAHAAAAAAVFAGMLATRYLTKRASVDYYHSLPIRREGLLLTQCLTGLVQFAVALAANVVLTLLILATVGDKLKPLSLPLLNLTSVIGYMALAFLLFYSLTILCGMLCGTSSVQVMLTGLCLGAWPLFRVLLFGFLDLAETRIDTYALFENGWEYTSPFLRLISLMDTEAGINISERYLARALSHPLVWWEIALWFLGSLALLAAALWLYRIRHVERAGTPIVFRPVMRVVKWVVIVLATMSVGWLFQAIGSGIIWLFFGFALGAFFSFLLMNTILTKNPKQMFEGWRAMIIYIVAFCLCSVGVGFAVSELEQIPPPHIDRIAISLTYENYGVAYYDDPAVIEAWREVEARRRKREDPDNTLGESVGSAAEIIYNDIAYEKDEIYTLYADEVIMSSVVDVGIYTIPYSERSYTREEIEPLVRAIANSAEFEEAWDILMEEIAVNGTITDSSGYNEISVNLHMGTMFEDVYFGGRDLHGELEKDDVPRDMPALLAAQMPENITYDYFQAPIYGSMWLYAIRSVWPSAANEPYYRRHLDMTLALNMNTPAVIEAATGKSVDEIYLAMADGVIRACGGIYIVHDSGKFQLTEENSMYITDRVQIAEALRGVYRLEYPNYGDHISPFAALESDWGIVLPYRSMAEKYGESVSYDDGFNGGNEAIPFIKGRVPQFAMSLS